MEQDDKEIISQVLDGDIDSYRELVEKYQDKIYKTVLYQVRCAEDAEDITQIVFVKAFKALASFKGDSAFLTWLTRIAINETKNFFTSITYKKGLKTDSVEVKIIDDFVGKDTQSEKELLEKFALAIEKLDNDLKEIIILCGVQGYSYEEVAEMIEIPIGTVRSRLNRARNILKKIFNEV